MTDEAALALAEAINNLATAINAHRPQPKLRPMYPFNTTTTDDSLWKWNTYQQGKGELPK